MLIFQNGTTILLYCHIKIMPILLNILKSSKFAIHKAKPSLQPMGLLRFLLIVFLIYLFFRVFNRFILPLLVRVTLRKVQTRFYEQNPHLKPEAPQKEGKVTIKRVSKDKDNHDSSDLGEYVDYEEIK